MSTKSIILPKISGQTKAFALVIIVCVPALFMISTLSHYGFELGSFDKDTLESGAYVGCIGMSCLGIALIAKHIR